MPVLADLESRLRLDLHDTDAAAYRWMTADLDRAIDRAVTDYSAVSSLLLVSTVATVAQTRTYPLPAGAWWIERVEYPSGSMPRNTVACTLDPPVAAGGAGTFTMLLPDSLLPRDNMGTITVVAAFKHQADATRVTVPDHHLDVVLLGAYAYCCYAWGTPMADNFLFADGELRDRLDDTSVPRAWLRQAGEAHRRFRDRLDEIRRERGMAGAAVARWGAWD